MDEKDVQSKDVEATTSSEKSDGTSEQKPPEPDKLAELEKKFDTRLEEMNRHWQSTKDREVKSAKREAGIYRQRAEQSDAILDSLRRNPTISRYVPQAEQSVYAQAYKQRQDTDEEERMKQEYLDDKRDYVKGLGIDVNDSRIDWGTDASTMLEATRRIDKSLLQIQKDSTTKIKDEILQQIRSEREETEKQKRREDGIDSIDTTASAGAGGKIFTTAQIKDRAFWEANKAEILKAQKEGRITE